MPGSKLIYIRTHYDVGYLERHIVGVANALFLDRAGERAISNSAWSAFTLAVF